MISPIFNQNTAIQAVLYVAKNVERKDFHKIFKILYFADREHLSIYGRTITGDKYVAMDYGPVPSGIYDIFKVVRGDSLFSEEKKPIFSKYFNVIGNMYLIPKKEPDMDFLSESDIEQLDLAIGKYGSMNMGDLTSKSHGLAWKNTCRDCPMDLKDIMKESGDTDEYIDYISEHINIQKKLS